MNEKVACRWVDNALAQLGRSEQLPIGLMVDEHLELMKHLKDMMEDFKDSDKKDAQGQPLARSQSVSAPKAQPLAGTKSSPWLSGTKSSPQPVQGMPWRVEVHELLAAVPGGSANQQARIREALPMHVSAGLPLKISRVSEKRTSAQTLHRRLPPAGYQRTKNRRWPPDDPRRLQMILQPHGQTDPRRPLDINDTIIDNISVIGPTGSGDSEPRPPVFPRGRLCRPYCWWRSFRPQRRLHTPRVDERHRGASLFTGAAKDPKNLGVRFQLRRGGT